VNVDLDVSGIGLHVEGLDAALSGRLRREWAPFVAALTEPPWLRLEVELRGGESGGDYRPKEMASELRPDGACFAMPEGRAEVRLDGRARLLLHGGSHDRDWFTLLNLLRACLAFCLPSRGGALLHAAGLVVDGRAFVLVGPEGSGKSSFARLGAAAGARVLSDDVVVLDGAASGYAALGSPLHSTHRADYRPGRWPLAALLFPHRSDRATATPARRLGAAARVTANLPFVAEGLERDPRIGALVERLVGAVPAFEFGFALDPACVDLLRGLPRAASAE